jgi:hypothetical protein
MFDESIAEVVGIEWSAPPVREHPVPADPMLTWGDAFFSLLCLV